jgi:hypothetical protein
MLKSATRRWRERRRARRARALEKQVTARENLRDYQPPTHTYNSNLPGGM